jgi:hypothetical protein
VEALTMDFSTSRTMRNTLMSFISPTVYGVFDVLRLKIE